MSEELLHNYHSHTARCLHARDTEEDYILSAINAGFGTIGFSDHTPWPTLPEHPHRVRMLPEELDNYVTTLRALRSKYADRIRVMIALECEAFPVHYDWMDETREKYGMDYYILGSHYDACGGLYFGSVTEKEELILYRDVTIAGMRSGKFTYLAHPDLCLQAYPSFDDTARGICRDIVDAAKDLDLPLEYNLLGANRRGYAERIGGLGYTTDGFWEIAGRAGVRAIVGIDAHKKEQMDCREDFLDAREKLRNWGAKLIDHPDGMEP